MINPFYERLAKLAINYSLNIEKGDRIIVTGPAFAKDLFQAIYVEILKVGAHPLLFPNIEGLDELKYKYSSEEQLLYIDPIQKQLIKEIDGYLVIHGDYNVRKLSAVDPKLIAKSRGSPALREISEILMERVGKRDLKYLIIPYACNSFAQEANMGMFFYFEFINKALYLDKEDPVKHWREMEKEQERICESLKNTKKVQVLGEDTDLTMSVEGRTWSSECGHINLPDGEVLTAPLEDSVNGSIRFTFPGIFEGNEIQNIYLEFKDGRVIKSTADKGEELLHQLLKVENADIIGEFAIGTNDGITQFTKNMLFDEKMGGTIHCALGAGIVEAGSKNKSAIHWDILKDMKLPGSKILADNKIIYEEGQWKI
jgi:aminopeptidase